jgi:glycerophosphoryl diester phosphodiesterase
MSRHPDAARERLVFAHRGGSKLAPENTMPAFEQGLSLGSDGIECDVHLSRDGVPIVIHDPTLDRTTDAVGPVSARTADELARVDAGHRFARGGTFPFRGLGVGVPRLEHVLRRFADRRVIIELKQDDPALARAVIAVVRRTGTVSSVCVGSFHHLALAIVRAEAPEIATSASRVEVQWTIYRAWCRWPFRVAVPYYAFQVPERVGRVRVVSPAFVRQAHRCGARVDVWVVDEPDRMNRLFGWGVDGVISDRPDLAVAIRDQHAPSTTRPEEPT